MESFKDTLVRNQAAFAIDALDAIPTNIDNMTPGNRVIRELSTIAAAPGVSVNSIIAVVGTYRSRLEAMGSSL